MTILEIKISEKEKKNEKNKKKKIYLILNLIIFLKILNKCYMIIPIYQIIQ